MKKIKYLVIIIMFLLSFVIHFIYTLYPNTITSIFFPVNESIWEHMKIISTSTLTSTLIECYIYKKKHIFYNNLLISTPIIIILGIIFYLLIYSIISIFTPHSLIISLILLFITYIIMQYISYKILNMYEFNYQRIIGIILIIFIYISFSYLTYYPPHTNLFIYTITNTYGINN